MDHRAIYETAADDYDRLVSAEDVDGNLARTLCELADLDDAHVVEIGAGTGRVTRLMSAAGARVVATEPAAAMIDVAGRRLGGSSPAIELCRAEAAHLPFGPGTFDLAIAGWVFAHQREWRPDDWRGVVGTFVDEARRVLKPARPIVLIETLGTGSEEPDPPSELVDYYDWLQGELGFERRWIRTDYQFADVGQAAEVTGKFFGPDFAKLVRERRWSSVPECTGIWTSTS